ncbi:hypothetical protein [Treponema endosymbiont of Eucomonympha sp.]|uniref:hypothetical protein n=1 Tax=Treponema endosymbiont of Eucomonympha sp. TaxID=1580831 RepID=UPI000783CCB5|nr:hypothetical protein [Treponema endosymbiont of Eucomonympha sp.]
MNKTRNAVLGIVSALALAGAGFALYSCDGFADAAAQAADAGRSSLHEAIKYKIRGPKGWVDYMFSRGDVGTLDKDYVLGTDRTVHVEDYRPDVIDDFRGKLEAAGITVTGSYSPPSEIGRRWVEFNLKEVLEVEMLLTRG